MKKFKYIWILLIFTIVGCSNSEIMTVDKADAIIKPMDQSEKNQNLFDSLGFDALLMYDVKIKNEELKLIHFWVEHYKNGEKLDDIAGGATTISKKDLTLAMSKMNFEIDEENTYAQFNLSISDDTAVSSYKSLPLKLQPTEIGEAKSWLAEETKIEAEQPVTVAILVKTGARGLSIGLDEDTVERTIKNSEEVYVVKTMLSTNDEYER